jgi:hypothetical protein
MSTQEDYVARSANGYCDPKDIERVQHICNLCKDILFEVRAPELMHRTEDMMYTRRYPFAEGTLLCPPCRQKQQIPNKAIMVEVEGDEDWEVALQRKLDVVRRIKERCKEQPRE